MSHRWKHAAALGWLALVAACVFCKVTLARQVLYWGDIMLYFLPMVTFARHWLLQHLLPLWNPHTLFGQPYSGNPQEWLFYPSTLLLSLLGPARYLSWNAVLHLWLGGVGMWLFLRALGAGPYPALLGSTAWMLSGAFVPRAQFPGMFQAIALIGWLMWAVERVARNPRPPEGIVLALIFALMWLAGHAQVAYMASLLAGGWILWRWLAAAKNARILYIFAGGITAGVMLSAVHWLPMLQLLRETPRVNLSVWGADRFALRPEQVPLLMIPDLYGTPWNGNWQGRGNYWEVASAVGIVSLMGAVAAWKARREARFWLVTALLTFWLALGRAGGLYFLAYYALPGMKAFHDPARWLILTDFALCVSAGLGWDSLRFSRKWLWLPVILLVLASVWLWQGVNLIEWSARHDVIRASRPETVSPALVTSAHATSMTGLKRTLAIALVALFVLRLPTLPRWWARMALLLFELLPFAIQANPTCDPAVFAKPPASAQRIAHTGGRLFIPEQVPMWRKYVSYLDYGSNAPAYLRAWQEMLGSNMGMMWQLSEASGYEPVPVKRAVRYYVDLAQRCKRSPQDSQLLHALRDAGVGAVATGNTADDWRVITLPRQPARAWMHPSGTPLTVRQTSPQQLEIANVPAGTIVLADTAYPGWKVWVDGKPYRYRVYRDVFRQVDLPSPASRVSWRYEPDTFRIGLYLSLLACALVSGILVFAQVVGKPLGITK